MSVLQNIQKSLFNAFKDAEARTHTLKYLFWEATLRCNLNCLHCGSDCTKEAMYADMPLEHFLKVLDQINEHPHDLITVVITGGEPLLRKDLEQCGLEIRKRGFRWSMVTNGLLYTPERHNQLLNAGMGALTLSLDGLLDNHQWMRQNKHSWQAAIHTIELLVKSPRVAFDVVTCVNKRNISELELIYNLLLDKGVKAWRLFTIAPIGRAKLNEELLLNANEIKQLMQFIAEKRKLGDMNVQFSCEGYVGDYETKVRDAYFFCRAGIHIGSVLINGDISACPNNDRQFAQGNIYTHHFMDVWNTQFEIFRNRNHLKTGICANCKEFDFCRGNGMHYHRAEDPNVLQCHFSMLNAVSN